METMATLTKQLPNDGKIRVRFAVRQDLVFVIENIKRLAIEEKMPDGPQIDEASLERDCFIRNPPLFKCHIAEVGNENDTYTPVGFAIFFYGFSSWKGKTLWLEDIFILSEYRSIGVGKKMISALSKLAVNNECSHIDFNVLNWNKARRFYKSIGSVNLTETINQTRYRIIKADIDPKVDE